MSHKKSKTRSVGLILIGLMLGAVTISPAFAHHTPKHTKKMIKKVKKALNKKIKQLPTTSAVAQSIETALDERINLFGDSFVKATATPGADEATARTAAPKIPLLAAGQLSVYGKCFSAGGTVYGEVFIETSAEGAIFASNQADLKRGGNTAALFLNPTTPETERQLLVQSVVGANGTTYGPDDRDDWHAMAPDGSALDGSVQVAIKSGTLTEGNGVYGEGDVCLFGGFAAGS